MPTALFRSPHLDDAAFSCGGTLLSLADDPAWRVVLCTVFTASVGNPRGFALRCQTDKGIAPSVDHMALRRSWKRWARRFLGSGHAVRHPRTGGADGAVFGRPPAGSSQRRPVRRRVAAQDRGLLPVRVADRVSVRRRGGRARKTDRTACSNSSSATATACGIARWPCRRPSIRDPGARELLDRYDRAGVETCVKVAATDFDCINLSVVGCDRDPAQGGLPVMAAVRRRLGGDAWMRDLYVPYREPSRHVTRLAMAER